MFYAPITPYHIPMYAELHAASAFSFLEGASQPEELVERAVEMDLPTVALIDRNGVYGAPRFYRAARDAGLRALVGAEVVVDEGFRVPVLVRNRTGYKNLCRLLTTGALGRSKGEGRVTWEQIEEHADGLHALTGGDEGPLAHALAQGGMDAARRTLDRLRNLFPRHLHAEVQRHRSRDEEHRNRAVLHLAESLRIPVVATNGVRYAWPEDRPLQDVLTCIREKTTLEQAGRLLEAQSERYLKPARDMKALFRDVPGAVAESLALADQLQFTLEDLGYQFPEYPLPPGETADTYLRQLTWNGARVRFRPLTTKAQRQLQHELDVIEKLGLAGYFLIVWDVVRFCKEQDIFVQGRGSAANSAVCYALSMTAVDPVKMELLFERFLSEERGEWPDIDLDLPSGDQREKVLQYVYKRYGPRGAAMTANVITYRDRSATREVGKVMGFSPRQVDDLAKRLGRFSYDQTRGETKRLEDEIRAAGLDPTARRVRIFADLWERIHDMPRHLGQHSGGMIVAAGRLDEVVPLEPAAMPGRVVIQWDKDDCADLGIVKVDLLGLGMLNALEEAVPTIKKHEGVHVDLAHIPPDDPKTYDMIRRADTVGVFQIESRAQMASLPKNRPERFYDLVIQVAIIRPGPIVGRMAHPYFERRRGRQEVTYPHPCLEPILKRTLGVPIFQEQILKVAMEAAGFTGGEAEQLRRAMGSKRSVAKMQALTDRLEAGMRKRGIDREGRKTISQAITSFALYGFPESHAASFALIAYASAYLKAHHPTAFYLSLLNAWPMGFYHPASLIQDARRHGVETLPIDVQRSGVKCRWEDGSIRLGMRFLKDMRREAVRRIEEEQAKRPFESPNDLARRAGLREAELQILAASGALACFDLTRRAALWQMSRVAKKAGPLLDDLPDTTASPLRDMTPPEETRADFETAGLTTGVHPMAHFRESLNGHDIVTVGALERIPAGREVKVAGSVIVRQRPGTAKGVLFVTIEDETGMVQAIVSPELLKKQRELIVGVSGVVIEGKLTKRDGSLSIQAKGFRRLRDVVRIPSHDFR